MDIICNAADFIWDHCKGLVYLTCLLWLFCPPVYPIIVGVMVFSVIRDIKRSPDFFPWQTW